MILEYEEFRQLFDFPSMVSLDTFKQSVKVKRNQKIMPYTLDEFITRMGGFRADHREQYWSNLYDICVTNREKTLREWYDNNISINDIDSKMFFDLNTDILSDNTIINASKQNKSIIGVTEVDDPSRYGIIEYNNDEEITKFVEKPINPKSNLIQIGDYYISSQKELAHSIDYLIENNINIYDINRIVVKDEHGKTSKTISNSQLIFLL